MPDIYSRNHMQDTYSHIHICNRKAWSHLLSL
jgi:hypothetical protein